MKVGTHWEKCLAPSTFCPVGVRCIEFHAVPGPEPRASRPKIMGRIVLRWPGRALYLAWFRAGEPVSLSLAGQGVVGAPGRAPERPAPFCGTAAGSPGRILCPPMLFPRNPAKGGTAGPQARFGAKKDLKSEGGKKEMFLDLS